MLNIPASRKTLRPGPGATGLAAVFAGAVFSGAASTGAAAGPVSLTNHVGVVGLHDDNIYLSRSATAGSAIGKLIYDLSLGLEGKQLRMTAGYGLEVLQYAEAPGTNNAVHQSAGLAGSCEFGKGKRIGLTDKFTATTDPASNELVERARRNQNDAAFKADFEIGPRLFLGLDAAHVTHYYMRDRLADMLNRKETAGGPRVGVRIGPKTRSYVRYAYRDIAYDFTGGTKDNLTHTIVAGAEGEFTSRLTGTVEAGVFLRDYAATSSTRVTDSMTSPAAKLGLAWAGPGGVAVSLTGARGPQEGLYNRFYTSSTLGAGLSRTVKRWKLGLLGSYGWDEYPDVVSGSTRNENREDGILQAGGSAGFQALKWLAVQGAVLYRSRESNQDEFDYSDTVVSLGIHLIR